jgi:hypothetical protein
MPYLKAEPLLLIDFERRILRDNFKMLKVNDIRLQGAPPNRDGYVLDDQPGYLLRIARRKHTLIFAKHMIEDLTMPQFSTLVKLRDVGPVSQNYLGRLIYYDSATMKGVADRLLARKLI